LSASAELLVKTLTIFNNFGDGYDDVYVKAGSLHKGVVDKIVTVVSCYR